MSPSNSNAMDLDPSAAKMEAYLGTVENHDGSNERKVSTGLRQDDYDANRRAPSIRLVERWRKKEDDLNFTRCQTTTDHIVKTRPTSVVCHSTGNPASPFPPTMAV